MENDGMTPFCWDKGVAKIDMMPRLRRVLKLPLAPDKTETCKSGIRQIADWVEAEENRLEIGRRKAKKEGKIKDKSAVGGSAHGSAHDEAAFVVVSHSLFFRCRWRISWR
jgi:hypothetical protein